MSTRLRNHLFYRLRHVARLTAVENAIELGILAIPGDEPSPGGKDSTRDTNTDVKISGWGELPDSEIRRDGTNNAGGSDGLL